MRSGQQDGAAGRPARFQRRMRGGGIGEGECLVHLDFDRTGDDGVEQVELTANRSACAGDIGGEASAG